MVHAQPYRVLPFVGALHAKLSAQNLTLAAARSSEARRAAGTGPIGRVLHGLVGHAQGAAGATLGSTPVRLLDQVLGTTARPEQLPQAAAVARGHARGVWVPTFGWPGSLGMAIMYGAAKVVGAVLTPVRLEGVGSRTVMLLGRLSVGCLCAVAAGLALAAKLTLAALSSVVGLGMGGVALTWRVLTRQPPLPPLAVASPPSPATCVFRAQDNLLRLGGEDEAEQRSRAQLGTQAGDELRRRGAWRQTSRLGPSGADRGDAGGAAALAALAAAQRARHLSTPEATVRLLAGVGLQVGAVLLDVPALLTATPAPQLHTRVQEHAVDGGPRAVQIDTLASWAAGSCVTAADGKQVVLGEGVLLSLTIDVEQPVAVAADAPPTVVREARLHIGQAAADALQPPPRV